jgi:hypothetical protein
MTTTITEVVWSSPSHMGFSSSWCWFKDQEIIVHVFIHLHNTCFIRTSIAVVGCWEYRHNVLLVTPIISLYIIILSHSILHSWQVDVLSQWVTVHLCDWTTLRYPLQRCNQHLLVRFPNHIYHLGLTRVSHTWVPHEVPLGSYLVVWSNQDCPNWEKVRHGDRRPCSPPQQWLGVSRRGQ